MKSADLFQDAAGHLVAGVDEVGRGPLAGDVVAAAVILKDPPPEGGNRLQSLISESSGNAGRNDSLGGALLGIGPGDSGRNR